MQALDPSFHVEAELRFVRLLDARNLLERGLAGSKRFPKLAGIAVGLTQEHLQDGPDARVLAHLDRVQELPYVFVRRAGAGHDPAIAGQDQNFRTESFNCRAISSASVWNGVASSAPFPRASRGS